MDEQRADKADRFWKWYSEAWKANDELREQLHNVTEERNKERKLRQEADLKVLAYHLSKRLNYADILEQTP